MCLRLTCAGPYVPWANNKGLASSASNTEFGIRNLQERNIRLGQVWPTSFLQVPADMFINISTLLLYFPKSFGTDAKGATWLVSQHSY